MRTLSGGQLRRLDLALALVGDPELVFLDEPTTGFDPAARRQAWETIRDLRSLGKSILLTTHYMEEAQRLADRVAILRGGRDRRHRLAARAPLRRTRRWRSATAATGAEVVLATEEPTRVLHELTVEGARGRRRARGARGAPPHPRGRLPRPHPRGGRRVRLFLHELRAQQLLFWRNREAAFFSFLFPILLLVLIGSVYGDERDRGRERADVPPHRAARLRRRRRTRSPALAITLVIRREAGLLKRVRGTPLGAGHLPRGRDRLDRAS